MDVFNEIKKEIAGSKNSIELLENKRPSDELLEVLQISERSTLGSILKYTNGILVHDRFLRLFGSGESEWTDSIATWNNFPNQPEEPHLLSGCLVFGYDLVGGFFAINGGAFGKDLGKVFYFAPDTLAWENLQMGHSAFISWCIEGDVQKFYESFTWKNAKDLSSQTKKSQGISVYPSLWSQEAKDINATTKRIVPLKELWNMNREMQGKV